jgi:hypothetical protein
LKKGDFFEKSVDKTTIVVYCVNMKSEYMSIRIDERLKKKVALMAKEDRRRFSDQVLFLMEKGLAEMERQKQPEPAEAGE